MNQLKILWIIPFCVFVIFTGCSSHSGSPTAPVEGSVEPAKAVDESESRTLWGIWDLAFDPASMEIEVQQSREGMAHFNITNMMLPPACSDCLDINVTSFDPLTRKMVVYITVKNPTALDGYDVRGILYTNDFGHRLLSSDGYTDKWDVPGGGSYNPFMIIEHPVDTGMVYAGNYGYANYKVYIPKPPHYNGITFAIDASWPAHVKEPRSVTGPNYVNIYKGVGSKANFQVKAFDYDNDVDGMTFETPIITGQASIPFTNLDPDTWQMEFTNAAGAIPGSYEGVSRATSTNSGAKATYHVPEVLVKNGYANTWGDTANDNGNAVTTDSSGNIFLAGAFSGTVDIDPGLGETLLTSASQTDALLIKFSSNGNLEWGYSFGSDSTAYNQTAGLGITTDNSGNVYMSGGYRGPVDFDPGPGVEAPGVGGAFIVKFDSSGNFQWVRAWGFEPSPSYGAVANDVVFDGSGSIYCVGSFAYKCDLNPDPIGEDIHDAFGHGDAYLSKFSTDGAFLWARSWGGGDPDYLDSTFQVDVDGAGNPYICGDAWGGLDLDPGIPEDIHTEKGAFICKYNPAGDYLWGHMWDFWCSSIAVDSAGIAYLLGGFSYTEDFDPGPGVDEHTSIAWADAFLIKFDGGGTYQWGRTWGQDYYTGAQTFGYDVDVNPNEDSIVCGGFFGSPDLDFDPGPGEDVRSPEGATDAFVTVFDSSGNHQWVQTFGGNQSDSVYGINYDFEGNIITTGYFWGTVDFDPGPGKEIHQGNTPDYIFDSFLSKFPPDGNW